MVPSYHLLLVSLVLALPTIQGLELEYEVINNARGTRDGQVFDTFVGEHRAKSLMEAATYFVWLRVFNQQKESDRKQVKEIRLIIQPMMTKVCSYREIQQFHQIQLKASYMGNLVPEKFLSGKTKSHKIKANELMEFIEMEDKVRSAINWILTYVIAYALQWTANNASPIALRGGIAAFAVLESHRKPHSWMEAGKGNKWNESFDVTAQFFYYINKRKSDFVANLNKKMRTSYNDSYFYEAAGKTIDECWKIYKGHYHTKLI